MTVAPKARVSRPNSLEGLLGREAMGHLPPVVYEVHLHRTPPSYELAPKECPKVTFFPNAHENARQVNSEFSPKDRE